MKSFSVGIEIFGWESTNSEIAEREVIAVLNKILNPEKYEKYVVHIDDETKELFKETEELLKELLDKDEERSGD